ncbi:ABC transporter ATP-binding protein [Fodinicurvata sediminis]|uniref:ABC transporter ATP-binding protein n=1 Tax=Fodinicurvata sediminis TaxID=1121832 RepID=UPI0003B4F3D7|nr:ABC transporter ATP-binding protein [Fodinicurvata sediminis]
MARIELKNLAHSYLDTPRDEADYALKEMTHVWEDGGAYALLGPSGCGKTTLLNIISGLLVPSQGQVFFNDRDMTREPPETRNIAQVFQFPVIYDSMSVYDNLAFPLRNRKFQATEVDRRVREVAEMLDLTDRLKRRAENLTADMKQKISLGRGLVRPDVNAILFDEPLTVIDPHMKWLLRGQLKQLHKDFNHTMVYVTHDQTEALTFADKVVVMYEGEVVQIGTPEELFEKPAHTFVGYFIGSPGMNVLDCKIEGKQAWFGEHKLDLPTGHDIPAGLEGRVQIGIRPEFVSVTQPEEGLPARLERVDDVGRYRIARLTLNDQEVAAILPEGSTLPSDTAGVQFESGHLHVYMDGHLSEGRP